MDAMPDTIALRPAGAVIHPTAMVARGAERGAGVRSGHYCTAGCNGAAEDGVERVWPGGWDGTTRTGPGGARAGLG